MHPITNKVRKTRASQLQVLISMFLLLILILIFSPSRPSSHPPSGQGPHRLDKKTQQHGRYSRYVEFVEKWYGTQIVISSDQGQDEILLPIVGSLSEQPFQTTTPDQSLSLEQNLNEKYSDEKYSNEKYSDEKNPYIQGNQAKKEGVKMSDYLENLANNKKNAQKYRHIEEYRPFQQLPFCLLVSNVDSQQQMKRIAESILKLDYQNYHLILASTQGVQGVTQVLKEFKEESVSLVNLNPKNYLQLKKTIQKCKMESIVMMVNSQLVPKALEKLNQVYQNYYTWMVYSTGNMKLQIHSFYARLLFLIQSNDFDQTNKQYLLQDGFQFLVLPFLELTELHSFYLSRNDIFYDHDEHYLIQASLNSQATYARTPYQPMFKLSQDFSINTKQQQVLVEGMRIREEGVKTKEKYLNKGKLFKALQYEQLAYLPAEHSLNTREQAEMGQSFKIRQFDHQIPICVTLLAKNNMEANRIHRSLLSILRQDYSNYHIVFIDDHSSDQTLKHSAQFLKDQFPHIPVTFIRNHQTLFPAFNILHAAYAFCSEEDIQVIVEGSDHLIGRRVFKFLNAAYQRNEKLWMTYTASMDSNYEYGASRPVIYDSRLVDRDNLRTSQLFMGPLASWKAKLIRRIPLHQFQYEEGQWLDSSYQISMMHPMMEAATIKHLKYVPSIFYFSEKYEGRGYQEQQEDFDKHIYDQIILADTPLSPIDIDRQASANALAHFEERKSIILKSLESQEVNLDQLLLS